MFLFLYSQSLTAVEAEKFDLPDMGDSTGALISPIQEKELGEAFFRSLHAKIKINQDTEIHQYIQDLGQKLVTNSDVPSQAFHFFVVIDNAINAFAGPGGYIGVNSGLILSTESESELASVMAHEIAHVSQRHLYRAFEAASQLSIPTAAATLAALLLGTQSPEMAQAALIAIQASQTQFQIDFTRSNEQEADRVGMQTLLEADYNPRAMPIFFERLQQSSRYYGRNIPEFLRTHPVTSSRISDSLGRAEKYPYKQYPDSLAYQLTKTKLKVSTSNDKEATAKYFATLEKQGTDEQRAVAKYGSGLLKLTNRQFTEAEAIFKDLTERFPSQIQFAVALAQSAVQAQNYQTALKRYLAIMNKFPSYGSIKLDYIKILLETEQAEKAKALLLTLNYSNQQKLYYLELLAQAYADLGQQAESHRYIAEYYYEDGYTEQAIQQIKLAKKSKGLNFYLSAILNERLNFFLNEERERKLNQ